MYHKALWLVAFPDHCCCRGPIVGYGVLNGSRSVREGVREKGDGRLDVKGEGWFMIDVCTMERGLTDRGL